VAEIAKEYRLGERENVKIAELGQESFYPISQHCSMNLAVEEAQFLEKCISGWINSVTSALQSLKRIVLHSTSAQRTIVFGNT